MHHGYIDESSQTRRSTMASTSTSAAAGWHDLPADILVGGVIPRLPFLGDRARICAVCHAWRSAARHHVRRQRPWIVLPDCSFCTTTHDAGGFFFPRIPGLPANNNNAPTTCLAAAGDAWLALDCTDDVLRRTPFRDTYCHDTRTFVEPSPDVKHSHNYMLHNPFSNVTVPLPELDALVGHVAETFEIRKVLMRSSPDDVIAVTTNNWDYNVILCRPGKGTYVLPNFRVIDVVFLGDMLYGVTFGEELVAFHLGEDEDERPKVTKIELVIRNPMARYYKEFLWSWPQEDDDDNDDDDDEQYEEGNQAAGEDDDNDDEENQSEDGEESSDDDEAPNHLLDSNGDGCVSDNDARIGYDEEVPYEPKDEIFATRYLVRSQNGELLLVRHEHQSPPYSRPYTRKFEIFKADVSDGKWIPINDDGLGEGEALFLSRSFSKSTRAFGDVKDGMVYYAAAASLDEDAFDTRSWTIRWSDDEMTLRRRPWQWKKAYDQLVTWLFPPELVV